MATMATLTEEETLGLTEAMAMETGVARETQSVVAK